MEAGAGEESERWTGGREGEDVVADWDWDWGESDVVWEREWEEEGTSGRGVSLVPARPVPALKRAGAPVATHTKTHTHKNNAQTTTQKKVSQ